MTTADYAAGVDYSTITEVAGQKGSRVQLDRACNRYYFAGDFCAGKDVLEVACGVGQGLGYLAGRARRVVGLDIEARNLRYAAATYRGRPRIDLARGDGQSLPFGDSTFDVVVLYEAIYYLPHPEAFAAEARRVLRPGGTLLVCTTNPERADFNRSPYSHRYLGASDLRALLSPLGFAVDLLGEASADRHSARQTALRLGKALAVRLGLIPKTMSAKAVLKRLVFGRLVDMPSEIRDGMVPRRPPVALATNESVRDVTVLFAVGRLAV
jgi:SAM-dependent methyltransferase